MTTRLRRVLVRPPDPGALEHWSACLWRERPDAVEAEREHAAFRRLLAEVVCGRPASGANADGMYVCDAGWTTNDGLILLRPGKPNRQAEGALLRRGAERSQPAGDLWVARIFARGRPGSAPRSTLLKRRGRSESRGCRPSGPVCSHCGQGTPASGARRLLTSC
jgi:hypothetical protein